MQQNRSSAYKRLIKFAIGLSVIATSGISHASESTPTPEALAAKAAFYSQYKTTPELLMKQTKVPGEYNPDCIGDKEDPMDFGVMMQTGPYKGECMDLSSNRPVVILEGDENSDTMTIANLRYNGKFWTAKFTKQSVSAVDFEIVDFGKMHVEKPELGINTDAVTAHTQVRYRFSTPIQLTSQVTTGTGAPETASLDDLTFTFNAYGVNGVGYDAKAGISGTFALVGKAIATADRSVEEIIWDKSKVALYKMDWTEANRLTGRSTTENMYHYLVSNFTHSQHMGYKSLLDNEPSAYQTVFRNCTTEAFDAMDEAFPELLAINGFGGKAEPFLWSYFPGQKYFVTVDTVTGKITKGSGDAIAAVKSELKSTGVTNILPLDEQDVEAAKNIADDKSSDAVTEAVSTGWNYFKSAIGTAAKTTSNAIGEIIPGYNAQKDELVTSAVEKYTEAMNDFNEAQQTITDSALVRAGFVYGVYKNISDLAIKPSIANLKTRGFWSGDSSTAFLNDEYAVTTAAAANIDEQIKNAICDKTTMCVKSNVRNPSNPTLGVRARVDAEKAKVAAAEAKAQAASAAQAAAETAKPAAPVDTKTATTALQAE